MKVLFDTSVLVAACVADLKNHEAALDSFLRYTKAPHSGYWTCHGMAEVYATLTAVPLKRRIQPAEAQALITQTLNPRLQSVEIPTETYVEAVERVTRLGLVSGTIYDAVHLIAAEATDCTRLLTYNLKHFRRLGPEGIKVTAP